MKRGRKRKNASTEEKEMQIPSSAVLPARRLSDVPQQTPPVILPIIKKEDSSPLIKKSKTDSIPLNTDVVDTEKNIMENQNLVSKCNDLPAVFEPNNELSFTHGSFNLQNVKSEPVSPVACATNATFDDPNYVETPPVILPIIKKEDSSPLIKKSKTDSIPLNTNVVDTEKNIMENQNLVSECNDLAVFEPNNKLSFTPGSFNLQNVKSEPVSPVACVTNATFDDPNYVEQNGGNLDHFKIKREPRSRSSSTETVLNEESLQLQQDECRRSSSAETLLNEESLELPMDECQSETSFPISDIYQVINPDLSSLRENSDLSSRKEADRPSFITPVHSPNISFSQHENELHMLTTKISLVTKLFKYNTFFKEIVIADAKESLNFLNSSYPSNGSFNLFFSNDTYLGQQEIPAIEPVKSIPIISSIPTVSKDISTDELKKIIEITQKLPDLSSPIKNNSENDNIIKDTNVNAPALTVSTSQLPIITKQQKESDHTFNTNIRIKDEPVDDYDSALVTSPSVNHLVLTCNKRSAEETPTKMQGFLKKTKISQLSLSATCIDSQIEPGDCTGKCDSIDTSKGGMQNQCLESARITSHTLKTLTPPNSSSYNTVSDNMLQNNATMCRVFSDRGTENRVATESFVSNSSSPKFTSYLHFLPGNIVCTDSSQRAVVSAEPMTSVSSNFTVLTTKSDSVVTKNYSQSTTAIDKFPACSAMQHVGEKNLGKERNPSDTNIGVALKQNDALKCMNPVMKAIILNPRENELFIQTTIVPPITNVSCMLHSIRTFEHRVTIINSPSPSISATATYQVASRLKTNSILLVAVKDKEAFLNLATRMKNLNIVLAIKENEVPLGMRTLTVNYCDFATLMSRQIILTLIPSMFFGKIESRLKKEPTICIICEAQCFFETETALLLAYKIEHLILIGMSNIKASTPSLLARYAFDVSLFHRISKKS